MPSVSVTATVLNEFEDIDRLVASLASQTLVPAEIVVVDGGSTDGTWERLEAARSKFTNLVPIRDESCSLQHSAGPIARGRNVAISAATSEVVACADAGCSYDPDWLERLTAPILSGQAEYAVGGSCLHPEDRTVWDIASAPFFGIKLSAEQKTKSCTARSMAFRKTLWQRVGGFPETVFLGEDTMFDAKVRALVTPAFSERAKAFYRPHHTFWSAMKQMASYARTDGVLGVRPVRLLRNVARCVAEVLAVIALLYSPIPLLLILGMETYFAFRLDWRDLSGVPLRALAARWIFSMIVPWVVAWNHVVGGVTKVAVPNRQNA
jgi:glycosyltransferase involved in cell wall biosynthesis